MSLADPADRLASLVRPIPDHPKPGILFRDITPLLGDPVAFAAATAAMAEAFADQGVTHVAAIESRGFILGGPVAHRLGAGFIPLRKPGKLPAACRREAYALEYGTDALEAHEDACGAGARVLIVDDVLATGGTAAAACRLVEAVGGAVVGCSFLLELPALGGRAALPGRTVRALLSY